MFSIYRDPTAMTSLKETWQQADEPLREAILQASRCLDQCLQNEPQTQGESRGDNTRIVFEAPLAVLFDVDEASKVVRILRAWTFRCVVDRTDPCE